MSDTQKLRLSVGIYFCTVKKKKKKAVQSYAVCVVWKALVARLCHVLSGFRWPGADVQRGRARGLQIGICEPPRAATAQRLGVPGGHPGGRVW